MSGDDDVPVIAERGKKAASDRTGGLSSKMFHFAETVLMRKFTEVRNVRMVRAADDGIAPPSASGVGPAVVADQCGMAIQRNRSGMMKVPKIPDGSAEAGHSVVSLRHRRKIEVVIAQNEVNDSWMACYGDGFE